MARMTFETGNETLRQLMGNGRRYTIPLFQRDYSWTQDEWEELWQDLNEARTQGEFASHYLGYLVLQAKDGREFSVVDGQQRLTTFSILVLSILKAIQDLVDAGIDADNNKRRIENLRNTYIGSLDPVTLISYPKLTLNRSNNSYYQDYIVPLGKLPRANLRSDQLLRKAFEWFFRKVKEDFKANNNGAELARFIDEITDRLFVTVIIVDDELNAFTVFETLNARGVRLSPTDLLKNYLFSRVFKDNRNQIEIDTLERKWDELTGRLGEDSFPDFLRIHWNSSNSFVREAGLFKKIRDNTPDKASVFALMRSMDEDSFIFSALNKPENSQWDTEQKKSIQELKSFGVRQPWPLLLAARKFFDDDKFTQILKACVVISMRYNIIGGRATGEQENVYNNLAREISAKRILNISDALTLLKPIYPNDREFETAFSEKLLKTTAPRNKSVAKHILFKIEEAYGQALDEDSPKYNLEHILPQNPENKWQHFSPSAASEMVFRIGNLTVIEASLNRDMANSGFADKVSYFKKSELKLNAHICDYEVWDESKIAHRQKQLAKKATTIWKISQLK
jgi:Protein of unknown function DUF262/Protein of unknown function (DUF1524)